MLSKNHTALFTKDDIAGRDVCAASWFDKLSAMPIDSVMKQHQPRLLHSSTVAAFSFGKRLCSI